jgi:hypothetical protein
MKETWRSPQTLLKVSWRVVQGFETKGKIS